MYRVLTKTRIAIRCIGSEDAAVRRSAYACVSLNSHRYPSPLLLAAYPLWTEVEEVALDKHLVETIR